MNFNVQGLIAVMFVQVPYQLIVCLLTLCFIITVYHSEKAEIGGGYGTYCLENTIWLNYSRKCTFLVKESGNFTKSKEICKSHNGSLVSIQSLGHLREMCEFSQKYLPQIAYFFLAATRNTSRDNQFVWDIDDSLVDFPNTYWMQGYGGDQSPLPCLELFIAGRFCRINDIVCYKDSFVLCEKDMEISDPCKLNNGNCDQRCLLRGEGSHVCKCFEGYVQNNTLKCVRKPAYSHILVDEINHSVSLHQSSSDSVPCSELNGKPFLIESEKVMQSLCTFVTSSKEQYPTDIFFVDELTDLTKLTKCGNTVQDRDDVPTLHASNSGTCCLQYKRLKQDGVYICQPKSTIAKCPEGWMLSYDDRLCTFFSNSTDMKNWRLARQTCFKKGGDLAQVDSDYKRRLMLYDDQMTNDIWYWMGLTLDMDTRKWYWVNDSSELRHTSVRVLDMHECGFLEKNTGCIIQALCGHWKHFLCEETETTCSTGFERVGQKCIKHIASMFTFYGAFSHCKNLGDNVRLLILNNATDKTALTNWIISKPLPNHAWIALKRDGKWIWLTRYSEKIPATAISTEPVSFCSHFSGRTWLYPYLCTDKAPYICERPKLNPCLDGGVCHHRCSFVSNSYNCSCGPGFVLYDDTECLDKDECLVDNGGCDHTCRNTYSSWKCSCHEGFSLENNKQCNTVFSNVTIIVPELNITNSNTTEDHHNDKKHRPKGHWVYVVFIVLVIVFVCGFVFLIICWRRRN